MNETIKIGNNPIVTNIQLREQKMLKELTKLLSDFVEKYNKEFRENESELSEIGVAANLFRNGNKIFEEN